MTGIQMTCTLTLDKIEIFLGLNIVGKRDDVSAQPFDIYCINKGLFVF